MRRTAKAKTAVWRWQQRFMEAGADGLLRDKTRPSRIPPLAPEVAERVVELTQTDPPGANQTIVFVGCLPHSQGFGGADRSSRWRRYWAAPSEWIAATRKLGVRRQR